MERSQVEKIYNRAPIFIQNFACSFEGWRINRKRYGGDFRSILHKAKKRSALSEDQLIAYRDRRLNKFVIHAAETVPFYRKWFKKNNVSPQDVKCLGDLEALPIINKDTVRENYHDMVSELVPYREQIIMHTSGTTGSGLHFPTSQTALREQWAIWWRYRINHGIEMGDWCAYFGGRTIVKMSQTFPPFWRYNFPGRQILFSGYHMNPTNISDYVEELKLKKPKWIHGYPSLITLVAAYILDSGIDLGYSVSHITTGAENLLSQQKSMIKKAFEVSPVQNYGLAEAVGNASQCRLGYLHVDEDFSAMEFLPSGLKDNEYKIVGTNFSNLAMPLIRYDTDDRVVGYLEKRCRCGMSGRIIEEIDGRKEDYIILSDGSKVGRIDHAFKDLVNIKEAQIYQSFPGIITVRLATGVGFTKNDESRLFDELKSRLGDECSISLEYCQNLERSSTGKLRFVISDIKSGQID